MKFLTSALAAFVCIIPVIAHADTVINLNATVNNGTAIGGIQNTLAPSFYDTITLAAGTYSVSVLGAGVNGAVYSGWDQAENTATGAPAVGTWEERVGFSTGGTTFSTAAGNDVYSPYPNATDQQLFSGLYTDAATALAASAGKSFSFTLLSSTAVTFYIPDQSYPTYPGFTDNTGGVSLDLATTATPEPSSLMLLSTGVIGAAGMVRRRFAK